MFITNQVETFVDTDEIITLRENLINECIRYFNENTTNKGTNMQAKILLDRIFNSWDLFLSELSKRKDFGTEIVVGLLKTFSIKEHLLKDEVIRDFYINLGGKL